MPISACRWSRAAASAALPSSARRRMTLARWRSISAAASVQSLSGHWMPLPVPFPSDGVPRGYAHGVLIAADVGFLAARKPTREQQEGSMRRTLIVTGLLLAATGAHAQGVPMSYQQWTSGPPIAEDDIRITWQGVTAWGYTVQIVNVTTGYRAVVCQVAPGAPWTVKGDDGEIGTMPANLAPGPVGPIGGQVTQAYAPAPMMPPPPPGLRPVYSGYDATMMCNGFRCR